MAIFLEGPAHSVDHLLTICLFDSVILVVSNFGFASGTLVLIVSVPGHC